MNYSEAALQKVREDRLLIEEVDRWLYEEIRPYLGRRVLEIGCGLGNFARFLTDRDLYVGIETSPESVDQVNHTFAGQPQMSAYVADATSPGFVSDFRHFAFDTVFSLNVFEHIEDHRAALRHAVELLQPGGNLILVVPAHGWLYGSIDRAIGHYRRYDKGQASTLFQDAGLVPIAFKYINALGALGWFVNGRLRKQETPPTGQLRLLNVIIPLVKAVERIVPMPFGISLLAVGQKLK